MSATGLQGSELVSVELIQCEEEVHQMNVCLTTGGQQGQGPLECQSSKAEVLPCVGNPAPGANFLPFGVVQGVTILVLICSVLLFLILCAYLLVV